VYSQWFSVGYSRPGKAAADRSNFFFYLLQFISVVLCAFSVVLCGLFAARESSSG
jgi:hypothetical protein